MGRIKKGIYNVTAQVLGGLIVYGARIISKLQSLLFLQNRSRKLRADEIHLLKKVFKDSISYHKVKIIEGGAGLFSLDPRPIALGNTIYFKNRDTVREPGILVHEMTHIWQYQHIGARYAWEAAYVLLTNKNAYSWKKEIKKGKESWSELNLEAQAEFLSDLFTVGKIAGGPPGNGIFFDAAEQGKHNEFIWGLSDYTQFANKTVEFLRT